MLSARKTTIVRVERPSDVSQADFVVSIRSWLSHQCILLANLEGVAVADIESIFVAEFDNPRDARLFARRFVTQPMFSPSQPRVSTWQTAVRSWARMPPMPARRPAAA